MKRTFTPGIPGWLIVHTPPDCVPELIIGDTFCGGVGGAMCPMDRKVDLLGLGLVEDNQL